MMGANDSNPSDVHVSELVEAMRKEAAATLEKYVRTQGPEFEQSIVAASKQAFVAAQQMQLALKAWMEENRDTFRRLQTFLANVGRVGTQLIEGFGGSLGTAQSCTSKN